MGEGVPREAWRQGGAAPGGRVLATRAARFCPVPTADSGEPAGPEPGDVAGKSDIFIAVLKGGKLGRNRLGVNRVSPQKVLLAFL